MTPPREILTSGYHRLRACRHGLMLYNRFDMYVGRSLDKYGEFSEGEVAVFRQLVPAGATVVEAGANLGAHTLALARMAGPAGRVYAFEPQRLVFQALCANMALNAVTNVACRQAAVGAAPGVVKVPALDPAAVNNFGGLGLEGHGHGEDVPVETVDGLGLAACRLLKVDVEGMELDVLRGAADTLRRCRPLLYVENDREAKSPALIAHLLGAGYKLYWHTPPLFNPANFAADPENVFGRIVSVNMVGVPAEVAADMRGFAPVDGPDSDWKTARPPAAG